MTIQAINPATGEALATYEESTPEQVERIVGKVQRTFSPGDPPVSRSVRD